MKGGHDLSCLSRSSVQELGGQGPIPSNLRSTHWVSAHAIIWRRCFITWPCRCLCGSQPQMASLIGVQSILAIVVLLTGRPRRSSESLTRPIPKQSSSSPTAIRRVGPRVFPKPDHREHRFSEWPGQRGVGQGLCGSQRSGKGGNTERPSFDLSSQGRLGATLCVLGFPHPGRGFSSNE